MSVSAETRAAVRAAYRSRCGYCGVPESQVGAELEVDHFRPRARDGTDHPSNLVYACTACNRHKGSYWPPDDAPDGLRLLHPGLDEVGAHLVEAPDGRLVGLTSRGWFHIRWLHLNRPALVELRQLGQRERAVRAALAQAEGARAALQQRIRGLESEVARLRETIARLTGAE